MTNAKLNELLSIAKQAQAQWDKWESEGEYDRSPEWKALSRSAQDAWIVLHRAIRESGSCILSLKNGQTSYIATVGLLTADQMMYYSEKPEAKYAMQGTNLKFVTSIEKVEEMKKETPTNDRLEHLMKDPENARINYRIQLEHLSIMIANEIAELAEFEALGFCSSSAFRSAMTSAVWASLDFQIVEENKNVPST